MKVKNIINELVLKFQKFEDLLAVKLAQGLGQEKERNL